MERAWASLSSGLSPLGRSLEQAQANTNLCDSVRKCHSQKEVECIMRQEASILEQRLSKPSSQTSVKDSLVRCIYCHQMGVDVRFAAIHAVKLAQQGQLLHKRLGYKTCGLLFEDDDDLTIMLVNSIQKDLQSSNIADLMSGLTAAGGLITADMIPSVLPLVLEKLQHNISYVRKRSVLCLHSFVRKAPDMFVLRTQSPHSIDQYFRQVLCDKSPDVMWATVHIYHQLIKTKPEDYKDITDSLVFVLQQIVHGLLPPEFNCHDISAPWLQISLIQCLALLGKGDLRTSEKMCPVLVEVLQKTPVHDRMGLAIIHECVVAVATIVSTAELLQTAANCVSKFLSAKTINLKYLGLKSLACIVERDAAYVLPYQGVVIDSLNHADLAIRRQVLRVLFMMTNTHNVKVVCQKLMESLEHVTETYTRNDIIGKIIQLVQQYSDDILWFVNTMNSLLLLVGDHAMAAGVLCSVISTIRRHVEEATAQKLDAIVTTYWSLMRTRAIPDVLLRVTAWVVGEYFRSSSLQVTDVLRGLYNCLAKESCSLATYESILGAITKVVCGSDTEHCLDPDQILIDKHKDDQHPVLIQAVAELRMLMDHMDLSSRVSQLVIQPAEMDGTLTFLDDYVCVCMESGAAPYKPQSLRQSPAPYCADRGMESDFVDVNFRLYESPAASVVSSKSGRLGTSVGSSSPGMKFREATMLTLPAATKVWNRDGVATYSTDSNEAGCSVAPNPLDDSSTPEPNSVSEVALSNQDRSPRHQLEAELFSGIKPAIKDPKED